MHLLIQFNGSTLRSNYTGGVLLLAWILLRRFNRLIDDVQRWHAKCHRHLHLVIGWCYYHLVLLNIVIELYSVNVLFIFCSYLAPCKYASLMFSPFDGLRLSCLLLSELKCFHERIVAYLYFANLIVHVYRRSWWSHVWCCYVYVSNEGVKVLFWFWKGRLQI